MTAATISQRANPQKMHRGSLYIPSMLYERLRLYSFVSRTSQSKIIEEAITQFLDNAMTGEEFKNVAMFKTEDE